MRLLNIFLAIVSPLSYILAIGHVPVFQQQLFVRTVPNELSYCSDTCLRYLAMRQYYTDLTPQSTPNFYHEERSDQRTENLEHYGKETIAQAFIRKIIEIENRELNKQNHETPQNNLLNESPKEIQFMHQLKEEQSNRNDYLKDDTTNRFELKEKLNHHNHFNPPSGADEQNHFRDQDEKIKKNHNINHDRDVLIELNTTNGHKVDAGKAAECAHMNCTFGNWTGPVCACNHVTGKVASFRNECDLMKHNCRFDTDFKTILEEVCPWEYPSRRSFSSGHILFDYNKDIYYNDDLI